MEAGLDGVRRRVLPDPSAGDGTLASALARLQGRWGSAAIRLGNGDPASAREDAALRTAGALALAPDPEPGAAGAADEEPAPAPAGDVPPEPDDPLAEHAPRAATHARPM